MPIKQERGDAHGVCVPSSSFHGCISGFKLGGKSSVSGFCVVSPHEVEKERSNGYEIRDVETREKFLVGFRRGGSDR